MDSMPPEPLAWVLRAKEKDVRGLESENMPRGVDLGKFLIRVLS